MNTSPFLRTRAPLLELESLLATCFHPIPSLFPSGCHVMGLVSASLDLSKNL